MKLKEALDGYKYLEVYCEPNEEIQYGMDNFSLCIRMPIEQPTPTEEEVEEFLGDEYLLVDGKRYHVVGLWNETNLSVDGEFGNYSLEVFNPNDFEHIIDYVPRERIVASLKTESYNKGMIYLDYPDLEITVWHKVSDAVLYPNDSAHPEEYDDEDIEIEYTYSVDEEVVEEKLLDILYSEDEFKAYSEDELIEYVEKNLDTLVDKYYDVLLDEFRDKARKEAEENYEEPEHEPNYESLENNDDIEEDEEISGWSEEYTNEETVEEGDEYKITKCDVVIHPFSNKQKDKVKPNKYVVYFRRYKQASNGGTYLDKEHWYEHGGGGYYYDTLERARKVVTDYGHELKIKEDKPVEEDIEKHDTLNPKLFEGNELKPEVKEALQKVVDTFVEDLKENEVDIKIKDVIIVGSNVSYNYTKDSDIDLHIIADSSESKYPSELLTLLYSAYRSIFNKNYDITIKGIPCEVYVEMDKIGSAKSNGIYSLNSGWIKEPVQTDIPDLNEEEFEKLFKEWEDKYFDLLDEVGVTQEEIIGK